MADADARRPRRRSDRTGVAARSAARARPCGHRHRARHSSATIFRSRTAAQRESGRARSGGCDEAPSSRPQGRDDHAGRPRRRRLAQPHPSRSDRRRQSSSAPAESCRACARSAEFTRRSPSCAWPSATRTAQRSGARARASTRSRAAPRRSRGASAATSPSTRSSTPRRWARRSSAARSTRSARSTKACSKKRWTRRRGAIPAFRTIRSSSTRRTRCCSRPPGDTPLVIPSLNRDGDCLSDLVMQLFGSIAGAESVVLAFDENLAALGDDGGGAARHRAAPGRQERRQSARDDPRRRRACSRTSTIPAPRARRARSTTPRSATVATESQPPISAATPRRPSSPTQSSCDRAQDDPEDAGESSIRPAHTSITTGMTTGRRFVRA